MEQEEKCKKNKADIIDYIKKVDRKTIFIVEKIGQTEAIDFLHFLLKFFWLI